VNNPIPDGYKDMLETHEVAADLLEDMHVLVVLAPFVVAGPEQSQKQG
jgi:hypothetical protein